jgi:hypothetical protein
MYVSLLLTMAALLAMAGCGCPTFAEMEVVDEADAGAAKLALVRDTIDSFAAWTGREGVCVPGVTLVPSDDARLDGFAGMYDGTNEPILISAEAADLPRTTRHELCHGLDEREELNDPGLFPPGTVEGEAFADACERDPTLGIESMVFAACGVFRTTAGDAFLRTVVYPNTPEQVPRRAAVTFVPRVDLDEAGDDWRVGEEAFALIEHTSHGDSQGVPAGEYLSDPEATHVDPSGVVTRVPLPTATPDDNVQWSLIAGDGTFLVHEGRDLGTAWRVDFAAGRAEPIDGFPAYTDGMVLHGAIHGDTLWYSNVSAASPSLLTFDLATHETEVLSWPDVLAEERVLAYSWAFLDDHLYVGTLEHGLLVRDLLAGTWEVVPTPGGVAFWGLARAGDRALVTRLRLRTEDGNGDPVFAESLLVFDLARRDWALADPVCWGAQAPFPVTVGGEAWGWLATDAGLLLGELGVGETMEGDP